MNILFHFRTQGTGAESVHIAGMAGAFRQLGHRVVFSSPSPIDPTATAGENPFRQNRRSLFARLTAHAPEILFELLEIAYNLFAGFRLSALLTRERFDLIYERHAFFLCITALLAQRHRVPLVVEVNELAGDERVRAAPWLLPLARWADRITFQRARLIVVVSPHLQRRIEAMGIRQEKILVLPNAVDEQTLEARADSAPIRQRYHCGDGVVIGFAGWFVPWHGIDALVAQFAALAAGNPELRLMLVGDGPLRSGLEAQANTLGVRDRLIFTGPVAHAEMPHYLAAMDICVVPHSNAYRSPIKLFEYMARGRAIVAPRTEPIAHVLRHGENGMLFDPEHDGDLRVQLAALTADPRLPSAPGSANKRTATSAKNTPGCKMHGNCSPCSDEFTRPGDRYHIFAGFKCSSADTRRKIPVAVRSNPDTGRSNPDSVCDQRWTGGGCAHFPQPERSGGPGKILSLAPSAGHAGAMNTTSNSIPATPLPLCAMCCAVSARSRLRSTRPPRNWAWVLSLLRALRVLSGRLRQTPRPQLESEDFGG